MADGSLSTESIVVFGKLKVSLTELCDISQNAMEAGLNRGTGMEEILSCTGRSKQKPE